VPNVSIRFSQTRLLCRVSLRIGVGGAGASGASWPDKMIVSALKVLANNWSPKRVRMLIDDGLPIVRIGRQMLINDQTLDQYLQEREASGGEK